MLRWDIVPCDLKKSRYNEEYYLKALFIYKSSIHYITYQYDETASVYQNNWYSFNDDKVTSLNNEVVNSGFYNKYFEFKNDNSYAVSAIYRKRSRYFIGLSDIKDAFAISIEENRYKHF